MTIAAPGNEIWVKFAGEYDGYKPTGGTDRNISFQLHSGVAVYGGFTGTENARDQRDPLGNVTLLSGDIGGTYDPSDNSHTVVTGSSTDALRHPGRVHHQRWLFHQ